MCPRLIEQPDSTPPFLTADAIQGWIVRAIADERASAHSSEINRLNQMHALEMKVQLLTGDGLTDPGSVGRLTKMVETFILEQRKANEAALVQRDEHGKQLGEIKQIPRILRDLWKTVGAIIGGVLLVMTLWARFHPGELKLTPQQIEQIKRIR
jgi:hypothetical protein